MIGTEVSEIQEREVTPARLLMLAIIAVLIWGWCIWFQLVQKTSLLDDAFIYLHTSNNILEVGSAQFYPVIDNPSLLASSHNSISGTGLIVGSGVIFNEKLLDS